jgi:DNA-directed RNA polymerase specialized sigma24 family protein
MNTDDLLRSIDDLLRNSAGPRVGLGGEAAEAELREDFLRACRQADENPTEWQRIDDIADLLDAEEECYQQALAAIRRGDWNTAVTLLRQCAEAGTGESAWLLAQLLDYVGEVAEAKIWYQRARDEGDPRVDEKPARPAANPGPGISLKDFMESRWAENLLDAAHALTGNPDEAVSLVREAVIEVWRSPRMHVESMRIGQVSEHIRTIMFSKFTQRKYRPRRYPIDNLKGKSGGPAAGGPDNEFIRQAIRKTPAHMHDALAMMFFNNMSADEVAKKLGLGPDAMLDYLMTARKAGLDVETRF